MAIDGKLLYRGYQFSDELVFDLYGEPADEFVGYEVTTATLTGSTVSLADLLSKRQLEDMGYWLDFHVEAQAKKANSEARASSMQHDRQMRQNDYQWRQA